MPRRSILVPLAVAALTLPLATSASAATGPLLSITPEQVGADRVAVAGAKWRVRIVLQPAVANQTVHVTFLRKGAVVGETDVALAPSATGKSAAAVVPFGSGPTGTIEIRASHAGTAEAPALEAKPVEVAIVPRSAKPGSRGATVRLLQRQLTRLGYVVGQSGRYDARTGRAVLAFRKVTGMKRTTVADRAVFAALARGAGRFKVRYPSHGRHVEADLSRQVLALIGPGGKVQRIYPTSSGAPVTPTVLGSFRIYSKTPGTNAKGMVHSGYFIRGYAIHGYAQVPIYPASHGCLRVPVPDALSIFTWLRIGTPVDVYP